MFGLQSLSQDRRLLAPDGLGLQMNFSRKSKVNSRSEPPPQIPLAALALGQARVQPEVLKAP